MWDCHIVPPPPTSDVRQLPSASIQGLFSCLCCIAFARQIPLLSMGHCFFLLLHLLTHTLSLSLCLFSLGPSFSILKIPFHSYFFSSPPPLLNMALTRGEAGLFLHVCQVLFLLPPPRLSIIPGSLYHRVALHEFSPALCHSILPFILPSPRRGVRCGAFALCQSASSLQSSRLPSSTSFDWTVVV